MNRTRALLTLVITIAVLGTAGCTGRSAAIPREPGCVTPPDEDVLLDDYAADPALVFVPDGARRTRPVERQHGCLRLNKEDVSQTSATTNLTLTRDYDEDALRAAYDPVATGHGWAPDGIRQAELGPNAGGPFLAYCRAVRGVTSQLSVSAQPALRYDVRPSGPNRPPSPQWHEERGLIVLVIEAAPQRTTCQAPVIP